MFLRVLGPLTRIPIQDYVNQVAHLVITNYDPLKNVFLNVRVTLICMEIQIQDFVNQFVPKIILDME